MARITVEDCLDHIENRNRFHLSLIASRRARQLREGAHPLVKSEEDDYTVLALREIATGQVTIDFLDSIDRELEAETAPGERQEVSADSVAEAAEALGASMAAGMDESSESGAKQGEEPAPEEPGIQDETEMGEEATDFDQGGEASDEEGP
ncbi:MAG: DNA-directed RNA polymerase subunit omega [Thiohalorhabdus sp.]